MSERNQNFFPNQRRITNHKNFQKGKLIGAGGPMVVAYWNDICQVMRITQNANAVLLWEYIFKNEDNYTFGLSPEEIRITLGIGKRAYDSAVMNLIAKGFLIQKENTKNCYDFVPYPWKKESQD